MRYASILATLAACALGCSDMRDNRGPVANDNSGVNARDQVTDAKTPINQNENQRDIDITAEIRKQVVDSEMSVNAQNVKIITQGGQVTLRGPVASVEEKKRIEEMASQVAGAGNVQTELEVEPSP